MINSGFWSDEEAIMLANDSKHRLGCAVFPSSQHRAKAIASQIHCGVVAINDFESTYICQVYAQIGMAKEAADAASQTKDGELMGCLRNTLQQSSASSSIFDTLRDRPSFPSVF
ncbi:Aldehyde dehydrogenase, C-terminal [Cynara cardunculus var. scolymus]|uniref:Aldehyde dehydrogenase, C-terminal n=1 Tax=Cynara cardunculus var. scolymus TaxID=59895 RepID=A0A118JYG0_CYNCS|nr:Aldehyde dehydrogenase, C-terminal [Cynara cardunculus var. scolymus]